MNEVNEINFYIKIQKQRLLNAIEKVSGDRSNTGVIMCIAGECLSQIERDLSKRYATNLEDNLKKPDASSLVWSFNKHKESKKLAVEGSEEVFEKRATFGVR